jgi:transcriptional regulator with XRE-family HTH domain
MKSFQQTFNELKKARGLSNKQIASFTGVKLKDVKQWETGTSFPIETKVVDALEGLLGTEISKSLEGYTSQSKVNSQLKTSEDNIFKVKNEKLDVTNTKIDKLRYLFQKQPQNTTEYEFDNEIEHITDDYYFEDDAGAPLQEILEKPYLYDENQLGFYFSRNLKTLGLLSVLGLIIFSFFQLFWDSFNLFIDNLL